jgi:hypothetical protein
MDPFTVAASLIMGSATLAGFGLLASLIVMERRPRHAGSANQRANPRRRTRPSSALVSWPAAARTVRQPPPCRCRSPSPQRSAAQVALEAEAHMIKPPDNLARTTIPTGWGRPAWVAGQNVALAQRSGIAAAKSDHGGAMPQPHPRRWGNRLAQRCNVNAAGLKTGNTSAVQPTRT